VVFVFVDFVVLVAVPVVPVVAAVPVIAVPEVSVLDIAVPVVSVLVIPVLLIVVPEVSVDDVLLITVPEVSLVVIVDEVSLAAVSVTFVFSSFLHANAKRARAITMRMARLLFIMFPFTVGDGMRRNVN
jgi:hypothetical protein